MNETIITNAKLSILKKMIKDIEENKAEIKYLNNFVFIEQGFRLSEKQGKRKKELKKLNKKHQKEINETIKNL